LHPLDIWDANSKVYLQGAASKRRGRSRKNT
jgi:hypothetical protein